MNAPLIIPRGIVASTRTDCCANCVAMHREGDGDLTCRLNPPQATVLLVPSPPPRVGMQPQPFSTFPIVTKDMWCRKFEGKAQ